MIQQVIDFQVAATTARRRLADLPGRVVAGDPRHDAVVRHRGAIGDFTAGTWTSSPGRWRAFADRDEFCVIVSGHVRLIAGDVSVQSFRQGDAFLIPNGFHGDWEVVETTTKHYVIRHYDNAEER